jgi:hypothetical protein
MNCELCGQKAALAEQLAEAVLLWFGKATDPEPPPRSEIISLARQIKRGS